MIPDGTLGGYLEKHQRPPAFEGPDGHSYSVEAYLTEDDDSPGTVTGSLLFVRWSSDGAQPVGHVETEDLVTGDRRAEVRAQLLALSLQAVKDHLDVAVARAAEMPDW